MHTKLKPVAFWTRKQVFKCWCVVWLSFLLTFRLGLLEITSDQFNQLKNLDFHIGQKTYSLTPNAQIWPRSLNTKIGGKDGSIYLVVSDLGSTAAGINFINGYTFLWVEFLQLFLLVSHVRFRCRQRFYSVYDTTNDRVGFATTEVSFRTLSSPWNF